MNSLLVASQVLTLNSASPSSFLGLSKAGLITVVTISVILIAAVVWLINGTKRRD
ncbi:MAG: hypothetical protein JW732_01115 [Dehalococcoidia bacterium]|nr:hypothetical protein [Dehalococcoidia bacterium]